MAFLPPPALPNRARAPIVFASRNTPCMSAPLPGNRGDQNDRVGIGERFFRVAKMIGTAGAAVAAVGVCATLPMTSRNSDELFAPSGAPIGVLAARAGGFTSLSVSEKLSQVPVFAVTNASGQPYLANAEGSGSQVGYIFLSHVDALNMLKDMQKNPGASDARVYIMGLDKAYEMVKAKPTPSGIRGSGGEELKMVFRFFPDSKQVKHAQGLLRKLRIRQPVEGVPVFVAKGLTLRKGNDTIVPLFLTKEDVDAAWSKLHGADKSLPSHATVEVGNLLYIIQQMEKGDHPDLGRLGFFAPRASVEYVSAEQAGPKGQARMHQNPLAK